MNKLRWLAMLMGITILGITGFQFYWLQQNYAHEEKTLAIKTEMGFRTAIQKLQASKMTMVLDREKHRRYIYRMNAIGRPTSYRPEFCELAFNYCLLGATNAELAGFFEVAPRTIDNWIARIPEFTAAVLEGRAMADSRVARGLYQRAVGYDSKVQRTVLWRGEERTLTKTVHHPPDIRACIFWLRNRRPRTWSDSGRDATDDPSAATVDDIAVLDAAGESVSLHGGD